jgi:hypothetical protein
MIARTMPKPICAVALFLALPLLAACDSSGNGPATTAANMPEMTITRAVADAYEHYLDQRAPMVFAVSKDGRMAYGMACEAVRCLQAIQVQSEAVSGCNDRYRRAFGSLNGQCFVFSLGRSAPPKYKVVG